MRPEIVIGAQLFVLDQVGNRIDRRDRDLARLAFDVELLLAPGGAEGREDRFEPLDPFRALAVLEILPPLFQQLLAPRRATVRDPLHQRLEGLCCTEPPSHHADVSVLARIDAGTRLARLVAGALADGAVEVPFGNRVLERKGNAFLAGDVDPLTVIGALALQQRVQRCDRSEDRGRQIALLAGNGNRSGLRIAAERQQPAGGEQRQIGGAEFRARSVLAIGRDRDEDDARVAALHLLVAEPPGRQRAGREGLDDDVAPVDEIAEQLAALRVFEVERDRFLVGVPERMRAACHAAVDDLQRRSAAQRAAAGRLDADDFGAEIAQQPAGVGDRIGGEIEHTNAGQCAVICCFSAGSFIRHGCMGAKLATAIEWQARPSLASF